MQECEGLEVIVESWYCLGSLEAMLLQFNSVTVNFEEGQLFALTSWASESPAPWTAKGYKHTISTGDHELWLNTLRHYWHQMSSEVPHDTSWYLMATIPDNKDAIGHYDIELEKYQL